MEKNSSVGPSPCHHHHHHHHQLQHHHHRRRHFQILHNCPLHSYMLQGNNQLRQNPEQVISADLVPENLNLQIPEPIENFAELRMTEDEGQELEDEDEDPIFVLTDEWRDFFAKSEAKRRLAKKHAKKKGKSKIADGNIPASTTDCNAKSESAISPDAETGNQQ